MAKPIRATPELKGINAENFIKNMIVTERSQITKSDKKLAKEIEKNSIYFKIN